MNVNINQENVKFMLTPANNSQAIAPFIKDKKQPHFIEGKFDNNCFKAAKRFIYCAVNIMRCRILE